MKSGPHSVQWPWRAGALALLAVCGASLADAAPRRIVSLDYCADQFVLGLADRAQIAAVSIGARRDDSYFRDRAAGLPRVRGGLEDVLAQRPDLIVRNWGGGAGARAAYARLGVPVLQVGSSTDFGAARGDMLNAARAFGQEERGAALARDLDARLSRLSERHSARPPRVLYLTAGGAAAGSGVLMDALIRAAGGVNARADAGWSVLPLESLLARPPEIVALGFFDTGQTQQNAWTYARHPALRRVLAQARTVSLPAGAISCEGWFAIDAAERLAAAIAGA